MTFEKTQIDLLSKPFQRVASSGLREKNVILARHPGIEVAWTLLFSLVHVQSGGDWDPFSSLQITCEYLLPTGHLPGSIVVVWY